MKLFVELRRENVDVNGKAGALIYNTVSDPKAPSSAWLRGSVPNYRAESAYITSGVVGNYEKNLENGPTMSVVGSKVPPRKVAYEIIDDAVKGDAHIDCTGVVDANGVHGVGHGTPPCPGTFAFKKPMDMGGSEKPMDSGGSAGLSKIWFKLSLDMSLEECDKDLEQKVKSALAVAAGVLSSDVIVAAETGSALGDGADGGSPKVLFGSAPRGEVPVALVDYTPAEFESCKGAVASCDGCEDQACHPPASALSNTNPEDDKWWDPVWCVNIRLHTVLNIKRGVVHKVHARPDIKREHQKLLK